ncbi:MAG: hypothetical protein JXN62_09970 [Bacteroidales bacterium]|nr:hypothetical protein [Bacteroidales bacterium]
MKSVINSKDLIRLTVLFISLLQLTGCASVKFYSDPDLKEETGLRFYTLKPYMLVEYKADKDNTVKTNVIYLPDISNPQYLLVKSGIGSREIKMAFNNSALTSYGVVTESEFPELFESIASMLSKSAYAAQGFTGAATGEPDVSASYFRLYEIIPGRDGTIVKEIIPLSSKP